MRKFKKSFRQFSTRSVYLKLVSVLQSKRNSLRCPHCQSNRVIGHGKYRDRNRYKCKNCERSFNDLTHTPLHYTHYPYKFAEFFLCILRGYSLHTSAVQAGIHYITAFYWRHKVLKVLRQLEKSFLQPYTSENLYLRWRSTYITFKNDVPIHLSGFSREEISSFQKWMKYYQWIKVKYLSRYIAWYRYICDLSYTVKFKDIEGLFLDVCSLRLAQSYQSIKQE